MFDLKSKPTLSSWGIAGTIIYFAVVYWTIVGSGWVSVGKLTLNEFGDFFAGVFGPPALIWVVISFYLQSDELRHSVDALNLQAEELKNSVTQQKEMVEVTKQQLELDIVVRKEETAALLSKQLPLIVVEGGGGTNMGQNSGRIYHFILKNIGAPAKSLSVTLDNDTVSLQDKDFGYLGYEAEVKLGVRTYRSKNLPEKGCTLTVTSKNIDGRSKVQHYLIGNFPIQEVKHKITYE